MPVTVLDGFQSQMGILATINRLIEAHGWHLGRFPTVKAAKSLDCPYIFSCSSGER